MNVNDADSQLQRAKPPDYRELNVFACIKSSYITKAKYEMLIILFVICQLEKIGTSKAVVTYTWNFNWTILFGSVLSVHFMSALGLKCNACMV